MACTAPSAVATLAALRVAERHVPFLVYLLTPELRTEASLAFPSIQFELMLILLC